MTLKNNSQPYNKISLLAIRNAAKKSLR